MSHVLELRVRGYHLDLYQHVNNARYLEFLEEARWAYFEQESDLEAWLKKQITFAIVNININYRSAAKMNDLLEIHSEMASVGHRSAVMKQIIYLQGTDTVVADADIVFVIVDHKTQRAMPIEGEIRALLESKIASAAKA